MTVESEPIQVSDKPRPKTQHLPRGEVHIFDNWCKGCGLCIEFCPENVLVLGMDNRPKPIYPENCGACRWCELHCPDFAIFVADIAEDDALGRTDDAQDGEAQDDAAQAVGAEVGSLGSRGTDEPRGDVGASVTDDLRSEPDPRWPRN